MENMKADTIHVSNQQNDYNTLVCKKSPRLLQHTICPNLSDSV
jgi:hypothetical protein